MRARRTVAARITPCPPKTGACPRVISNVDDMDWDINRNGDNALNCASHSVHIFPC